MSNQDFTEIAERKDNGNTATPPKQRAPSTTAMIERVPKFGGLPGKTQPGNRSGGVKKLKVYPQSEGL